MKEKIFENQIKKYLEEKGCWCVKFFANSYTKVGIADVLACINGHFVAIEVKAENGKPSPLQLVNQERVRASKGISIIVYPNQWMDFVLLVDDLLAGRNYSEIFKEQYEFDKE